MALTIQIIALIPMFALFLAFILKAIDGFFMEYWFENITGVLFDFSLLIIKVFLCIGVVIFIYGVIKIL